MRLTVDAGATDVGTRLGFFPYGTNDYELKRIRRLCTMTLTFYRESDYRVYIVLVWFKVLLRGSRDP